MAFELRLLEDVVENILDRRGVTPFKLGGDFVSFGHRVISAKLVKGGRVDLQADEPRYVDTLVYKKWMKIPLRRDDVIMTSEAPLGELAYLDQSRDWVLGQRLFAIRPREGVLSGRFLYYVLASQGVRERIISRASGTTVQGIRQAELRKVQIPVPPLRVQLEAAEVLGAIDDRIDNLRQTNATLKAIAQALFKSWFVDFDPVRAKAEGREPEGMDADNAALFPSEFENSELGPIPKGWHVSTIGDETSVIDCLHAKKPELLDSGRSYLQLNCIRDDGLLEVRSSAYISESDYAKWISRIEAQAGDCVITNVGRVGAVAQMPTGFKAAIGRNMTAIRPNASFPPTFLIELLMSDSMRREIEQKTDAGTILSALNVKSIPNLRFVRPPGELLVRFERMCRPMRAAREGNLARASSLADLRDTLLPRLISGKLRLPTADAVIEETIA
jgi:type I restriction enzyme S subunit